MAIVFTYFCFFFVFVSTDNIILRFYLLLRFELKSKFLLLLYYLFCCFLRSDLIRPKSWVLIRGENFYYYLVTSIDQNKEKLNMPCKKLLKVYFTIFIYIYTNTFNKCVILSFFFSFFPEYILLKNLLANKIDF